MCIVLMARMQRCRGAHQALLGGSCNELLLEVLAAGDGERHIHVGAVCTLNRAVVEAIRVLNRAVQHLSLQQTAVSATRTRVLTAASEALCVQRCRGRLSRPKL